MNVIMLKVVYKSILKTFLAYFFIIVAFSTSFYVLFRKSFLSNYGAALCKIFIMVISEIDSSDLIFENVSYAIVIFFVTLITICLTNLLTALAVGDIQEMKKEAEFHTKMNI